MREKSGKMKALDYVNVNMNPTSLALTAVWATGIIGLFVRIAVVQAGN